MSNDATATQEEITLTVAQLEGIIRKVVREELIEFSMREQGIFDLNEESPLYEDMEDILERKKAGRLRFHTREEIWNGVGLYSEMPRREGAGVPRK